MCCDVDVSAASLMRIIGGRLLCGGGARRSRAPTGWRCVRPLRSLRHVAGALASRAAVRARGVAFMRRRSAPQRRQRRRGCRGRDPQYLTCRRRPVLTPSPNILTSVLFFSVRRNFRIPQVAVYSFYRAMPCIRGTSHGPVSVSVSVRHKSEFY